MVKNGVKPEKLESLWFSRYHHLFWFTRKIHFIHEGSRLSWLKHNLCNLYKHILYIISIQTLFIKNDFGVIDWSTWNRVQTQWKTSCMRQLMYEMIAHILEVRWNKWWSFEMYSLKNLKYFCFVWRSLPSEGNSHNNKTNLYSTNT